MNQSTRMANVILQERGYVIMSFQPGPKEPPKVGSVISGPVSGGIQGEMVQGPFRVIGTATAEEMDSANAFSGSQ